MGTRSSTKALQDMRIAILLLEKETSLQTMRLPRVRQVLIGARLRGGLPGQEAESVHKL